MKNGIYSIANTRNGKRYIGSASCTRGFMKRKSDHFSNLRKNQHVNRYLQAAWNKYGEDAFEFQVVLYCDSIDCLFYEQLILDHCKPEYNIQLEAKSSLGVKRSEETRKRMSEAQRGKRLSATHRRLLSERHQGVNRGTNNGQSCLTPDQVREIRSMLISHSLHAIGKQFGISHKTVAHIRDGITWGWLS